MTPEVDLLAAARGGDDAAWAELYRRHAPSAKHVALALAGPGPADDLVAEAFTRTLAAVRRGKGPEYAFRPYLLAAVRTAHVNHVRTDARYVPTTEDGLAAAAEPTASPAELLAESGVIAAAFASLPDRWQAVLWATVVDQQSNAEVSSHLGIGAGSVAALSYRAREGFRQAYLAQHVERADSRACRETRGLLPGYHRGALRPSQLAVVTAHLESCSECEEVAGALSSIMTPRFAGLLVPALLGLPLTHYPLGAALVPPSALSVPGTTATAAPGMLRRVPRPQAVVAAAAVVAIALAAAVALAVGGRSSPDRAAARPAPASVARVRPVPATRPTRRIRATRPARPVPAPAAVAAVSVPPAPAPPTSTPSRPPAVGPAVPPPAPPGATGAPGPTLGPETSSGTPATPPPDVVLSAVALTPSSADPHLYALRATLASTAPQTWLTFQVPGLSDVRVDRADQHPGLVCWARAPGEGACRTNQTVSAEDPVQLELVLDAAWSDGWMNAVDDLDAGSTTNLTHLSPTTPPTTPRATPS